MRITTARDGRHSTTSSTCEEPSRFATSICEPTTPGVRVRKRAERIPGIGPQPRKDGQLSTSRIFSKKTSAGSLTSRSQTVRATAELIPSPEP